MTESMTQKEAFLKYFQEKNVDMLDLVLSDSASYFGTDKTTFIEKLELIFSKYIRDDGIVRIRPHNTIENVYFVLFYSWSLAQVMIIEEDSGNITRIYNNHKIKNKVDARWIEEFHLIFGTDEKIGFVPSDEYIITLHQCEKAFSKINKENDIIMTMQDLEIYLNQYADLYAEVEPQYMYFRYNRFRNLYSSLEFNYSRLKHFEKAWEALKTYNNDSREELIDWLDEYYELAWCKVFQFDSCFKEIDYDTKILRSFFPSNIRYYGEEFIIVVLFCDIYYKNYNALYGKY